MRFNPACLTTEELEELGRGQSGRERQQMVLLGMVAVDLRPEEMPSALPPTRVGLAISAVSQPFLPRHAPPWVPVALEAAPEGAGDRRAPAWWRARSERSFSGESTANAKD